MSSHHGEGVGSIGCGLLYRRIGMVVETSSLERLLGIIVADLHSDRSGCRAFDKTWRARKRSLRPRLTWIERQR